MKNSNLIVRGYKDIFRIRKSILPLVIVLNIIIALRPFINILIPAYIIDSLSTSKDISKLIFICFLGVFGNFAALASIGAINTAYYSGQDAVRLHEKLSVSKKLLRIDLSKLEDVEFRANLEQHRDEQANGMGYYGQLLFMLKMFTTTFVSIIVAGYTMRDFWMLLFTSSGNNFVESQWFGIAFIIVVIIIEVGISLISGIVNKKIYLLQSKYADTKRIFNYYRDMLINYKTGKEIRILKEQDFILKHATSELVNNGIKLQNKIVSDYAILQSIGTLIFSVVSFCIYVMIGLKARAGLFSIGDMVTYIGCFLRIVYSINGISMLIGCLKNVYPRAKLYYRIIDSTEFDEIGGGVPYNSKHVLKFVDVCFKYKKSECFALQNVNLTINSGDKVAIVGENGSGKTTLIKLLCGFYKPITGKILFDGKSISEYDLSLYRKLFSIVFQDSRVLSLPLGQNVATSFTYDKDKVQSCLKQVELGENYDLQEYLYKDCCKNGIEISGGEEQKIILARALYKDAPIIILDEPTAALDPISEINIYRKIKEITDNKTTIFISHRLSSCKFCDKIAVFDQGRLVQFGSHDTLIQNKHGKYYELWNAQAKYYVSTCNDSNVLPI